MPQSSALSIRKLGQVSVPVKDVARAVVFYRDVLELKLLFQTGNMAIFELDGLRLLFSVAESPEFDHPGSVLYYDVPDIHAAYELLRSRNVEFLGAPHAVGKLGATEVWMAFCRDTEGNVLAIMSEVAV
ncbi:glyoxalase [Gordoniibacillus kamchatkensis]|uniref:Glyoxalase n=2 Tax=Gordoniibacillus kamchatkensis TaxID=1590651 RepID=A0ABR5AP95_9BACL|nr:VOC family protein [Paenibacillus sp. VKM B-2647]KIL42355.1 glyoxalase [Paenibacillus sp. VKM B-2647]